VQRNETASNGADAVITATPSTPLNPAAHRSQFIPARDSRNRIQRKRVGTIRNERQSLARWCDYFGHVRVDQISTQLIGGFLEKRLKGGMFCGRHLDPVSERTANLDVLMLRNVLNAALDDGLIRELPKVKKLDEPPPPLPTVSKEVIRFH
jgi:hypothetical protein